MRFVEWSDPRCEEGRLAEGWEYKEVEAPSVISLSTRYSLDEWRQCDWTTDCPGITDMQFH